MEIPLNASLASGACSPTKNSRIPTDANHTAATDTVRAKRVVTFVLRSRAASNPSSVTMPIAATASDSAASLKTSTSLSANPAISSPMSIAAMVSSRVRISPPVSNPRHSRPCGGTVSERVCSRCDTNRRAHDDWSLSRRSPQLHMAYDHARGGAT